MCVGVQYFRDGEVVTVHFESKKPFLPVRARNGRIVYVKWGARSAGEGVEDDTGPGHIKTWHEGGWAPLDAINTHAWQRYDPKPVRIVVARFAVFGPHLLTHWVALKRGEYLQGLLATAGGERRVYVVTVHSPERLPGAVWPRIVMSSHA